MEVGVGCGGGGWVVGVGWGGVRRGKGRKNKHVVETHSSDTSGRSATMVTT